MDVSKLFEPSKIRRLSKDETMALYKRHMMAQYERAEAAEAEAQRYREGLRDGAEIAERYMDTGRGDLDGWIDRARALLADSPDGADEWFIPEGDRVCGVVHRDARATCMKRRGHDGPHATPQGTWIDGPWCEYPDGANTEGGEA